MATCEVKEANVSGTSEGQNCANTAEKKHLNMLGQEIKSKSNKIGY